MGSNGAQELSGADPLVGREPELAVVRSRVSETAGGTPGLVLLTGHAGVGKTRLGAEVLRSARERGFLSLAGRAPDVGGELAYAPLNGAFGPYLRALARRELHGLVGDLPQLALIFSGIDLRPPQPLGDPGLERLRVADGLVRLLERLVRRRPLALLLDDLHAADPATLSLLRYLLVSLSDQPLLLVATARRETSRGSVPGVEGLDAPGWKVTQLAVEPLPDAAARQLLERRLGGPVGEDLADAVLQRCAGRPLFVEALARTLQESGRLVERQGALDLHGTRLPLPLGIQAQLRARLVPVPPSQRPVLDVLAVAGGELDVEILRRATDLSPPALLDALERLDRRGLVVSRRDAVDVAHGLLRETVLAELSPLATQRAHARLVRALEAVDPSDPRLANQVLGAGKLIDPDTALAYLRQGAARSRRIGAAAQRRRFLSAAVTVAREAHRRDALAPLLEELGEVQQLSGAADEARARLSEALERYRAGGDAAAVTTVATRLAMLEWAEGDLARATAWFEQGIAELEQLEGSPDNGDLLLTQAVLAGRLGDHELTISTARRLRQLAERVGTPELAVRAGLADMVACFHTTDYVAMTEHGAEAARLAASLGDAVLTMRVNDRLSVAAASQGALDELRRTSRASLDAVRRLGGGAVEPWPRCRMAFADLLSGEWDAALRATTESVALARRWSDPRGLVSVLALHALVLVHRGRLGEARAYVDETLDQAAGFAADHNVSSSISSAAAALAMAEGDLELACRHAEVLDDLTAGWFPLFAAALLGEARAAAGDRRGARLVADRLRGVRSCATELPTVLASWIQGLADQRSPSGPSGVQRLRSAAAGFARLGLPFYEARARLALAAGLADTRPPAARAQARRAFETFDRLGAPRQLQQARQLLRGLGAVPSRGRAKRVTGGPFSPRELEVARLVAAGLTNAQVAAELFVSPRTVTTHLDHIYARLGLSSRVALTRYLVESGLLADTARS